MSKYDLNGVSFDVSEMNIRFHHQVVYDSMFDYTFKIDIML